MRKTNTIPVVAVALCCPTLNYAHYNSYEAQVVQVEQEFLSLLHTSQITAVFDWLNSPTIQATLSVIAACCLSYFVVTIVLYALLMKEALPKNLSLFLREWMEITPPVAVPSKVSPTFFAQKSRVASSLPIHAPKVFNMAAINFIGTTEEETIRLRKELAGKRIEFIVSDQRG